jgi:hypothetical protein
MMFWRPFDPVTSKDKAKTRLLDVVHTDVIGPMQTETIRGYWYIIMFTDDSLRFTEVYFMKLKSESPVQFKEYVERVEKQHSKSQVCRITVAGGGQ